MVERMDAMELWDSACAQGKKLSRAIVLIIIQMVLVMLQIDSFDESARAWWFIFFVAQVAVVIICAIRNTKAKDTARKNFGGNAEEHF